MPESEWEKIRHSKDTHRDLLAALPFDEKMRRLEELRDRMRQWRGSTVTRTHGPVSHLPVSGFRISMEDLSPQVALNRNVSFGFFGAAPTLVVAMVPSQVSTVQAEIPFRVPR